MVAESTSPLQMSEIVRTPVDLIINSGHLTPDILQNPTYLTTNRNKAALGLTTFKGPYSWERKVGDFMSELDNIFCTAYNKQWGEDLVSGTLIESLEQLGDNSTVTLLTLNDNGSWHPAGISIISAGSLDQVATRMNFMLSRTVGVDVAATDLHNTPYRQLYPETPYVYFEDIVIAREAQGGTLPLAGLMHQSTQSMIAAGLAKPNSPLFLYTKAGSTVELNYARWAMHHVPNGNLENTGRKMFVSRLDTMRDRARIFSTFSNDLALISSMFLTRALRTILPKRV